MRSNPKNILFIRSDRLGEFLLSLYAIKLTKDQFPESKILLLAKRKNIELIRGVDFIDEFIEYQETLKGFKQVLSLRKIFKSKKIDCVISLNPKREFHLASFLAGIPQRVGYDRKWSFCLNKKIQDRKYLNEKHEVEYNIDLASLICKGKCIPKVILPADPLQTLEFLCKKGLDLNKKYIIFHPFSSNPQKNYPLSKVGALIKKITQVYKKEMILIGSYEFFSASLEIEKIFSGFINLCGMTTLRNLATLFKYCCQILISTDSGPMHLASFFENKIVALFSITNPRRWGPFRTPYKIIKRENIEKIEIGDVMNALLDFF